MTLTAIATEVHAEIHRAWEKFGPQYDVPDVDQVLMTREGGCTDLRMAQEYEIPTSSRAKWATDLAFQRGQLTWAHILVEEVAESIEAATTGTSDALRAELLQVAAVAMRWVDTIDVRARGGDRLVKATQECVSCGDSMTIESDNADFVVAMCQGWDAQHRTICTGAGS